MMWGVLCLKFGSVIKTDDHVHTQIPRGYEKVYCSHNKASWRVQVPKPA